MRCRDVPVHGAERVRMFVRLVELVGERLDVRAHLCARDVDTPQRMLLHSRRVRTACCLREGVREVLLAETTVTHSRNSKYTLETSTL